jgi:hypothetical protein
MRKFNTQINIPKSFNSNRIENLLCKKFSTLEKKSELQKYVTYEDLQKRETFLFNLIETQKIENQKIKDDVKDIYYISYLGYFITVCFGLSYSIHLFKNKCD